MIPHMTPHRATPHRRVDRCWRDASRQRALAGWQQDSKLLAAQAARATQVIRGKGYSRQRLFTVQAARATQVIRGRECAKGIFLRSLPRPLAENDDTAQFIIPCHKSWQRSRYFSKMTFSATQSWQRTQIRHYYSFPATDPSGTSPTAIQIQCSSTEYWTSLYP